MFSKTKANVKIYFISATKELKTIHIIATDAVSNFCSPT